MFAALLLDAVGAMGSPLLEGLRDVLQQGLK